MTLSRMTPYSSVSKTVLPSVPAKLRQYRNADVEPQLRHNMEVGCAGWTNNACDSMNHVLKQHAHWRLQNLPELIDKCRSLVDTQYKEADRAMLGLGDFSLRPTYGRHRQTLARWQALSERQRQHVVAECFRLQLPADFHVDGRWPDSQLPTGCWEED